MNKVLIGWGIDPNFADDVDETIMHADGGAFVGLELFVPGNLRWRYEALYPALSPSVEYVADETQGDTPFDTYSAGNPHLLPAAHGLCAWKGYA